MSSSTSKNGTSNHDFAQRQKTGMMMVFGMAVTLVTCAVVVATSLPVSEGIKLSPMDADEVAAQLASDDASQN